MNLRSVFRAANQWFLDTPERALDQAYRAALMIKAIEDEHFNGKKISARYSNHSESVLAYFEADLKKYLKTIKVRLAEFKSCRSVFSNSDPTQINTTSVDAINNPSEYYPIDLTEQQSIIIEKLDFIDQIVTKYSQKEQPVPSASLVPVSLNQENQVIKSDLAQVINSPNNSENTPESLQRNLISKNGVVQDIESVSGKTGVLPRSILRTFSRLQEELDPKAEEKIIKNFRNSKLKTVISLKFILTLVIVPILTHQITKTFLIGPVVDHFREDNQVGVFLNLDMEEEAFVELKRFEEELRFKSLLGLVPELPAKEMEERVKDKAKELAEEYRTQGSSAIKNIFADLLSLVAFALVVFSSKQEILILKSFMDDLVYGLSDSAKAFVIILFTDIFVGFHSPHGWEVILSGISKHLGLPENQDFIFLFIATFPVILDSVFKYWIFRYLNRVSPSAVATYRTMNE
jgi:hypothetical protein